MALTDALRGSLSRLSPKDRRALAILAALLTVAFVLTIILWSRAVLDEIDQARVQTLEALRVIRTQRTRIRARQQQRAQVLNRYAERVPALGGFVEQAARVSHITVAETNDRPVQVVDGGRFERRSVSIRIRDTDLQSLVAFMAQIDGSRFPIAITTLNMRKRFHESNKYDVDEMVITTFDRVLRAGERDRNRSDAGVRATAVAPPTPSTASAPSVGTAVMPSTAASTFVPNSAGTPTAVGITTGSTAMPSALPSAMPTVVMPTVAMPTAIQTPTAMGTTTGTMTGVYP